jgi:formylglycine-generating enzyme required for sulfatase activity
MSQDDKKTEIIKRPADLLMRPAQTGPSLASRGLALLNQGRSKPAETASKTPSPTFKVGDTKSVILPGGVEMLFCYIPAGEFWMGSPEREKGRSVDELLHRVVLTEPFWLGMYPVTQDQWGSVIDGTEEVDGGLEIFPSWSFGENRPVDNVSWFDCREFLGRINLQVKDKSFSLPTEAQWEYACRAGTTSPFSFGSRMTHRHGNFGDKRNRNNQLDFFSRNTSPVGSFQIPNAWGLYDLHGNVWEWCSDWYDEVYYQDGELFDPKGRAFGGFKVLRGGSWQDPASSCRSAKRHFCHPNSCDGSIGFRLAFSEK